MTTLAKFILGSIIAGVIFAYVNSPPALADPGDTDTVGVQARAVCRALDYSPTIATMEREVLRLEITYTQPSEQKVMWFAMHQVCPEYMPLAVQAALDMASSAADSEFRPGVVA
jgi:hypothetical protein